MNEIRLKLKDMGTPIKIGQPVSLTIDGQTVTVAQGTSVMRAAAEAGIAVPKLCATDSLDAFGSCRVCLVEIEGRKGYPASCTTAVEEGMEVRTQFATAGRIAPQRGRALRLRPSAGLRELLGQRRLRIAGRGRFPGRRGKSLRAGRRRLS